MAELRVAHDGTVADLAPGLPDPVEHVRSVLEKLYHGKREHGAAMQVRIGLPAKGVKHRYRVEEAGESDGPAEAALVHGLFDGKTHKPIVQEPEALDDETWSTRVMTLEEVATLLGELRGVKSPVKPATAAKAKNKKK